MASLVPEGEINPLVAENVAHNNRQLSYIRNMTCPLFGLVAGTLGMTSYAGFLFYLVSYSVTSAAILTVLMRGRADKYMVPAWSVWTSQLGAGLPGYILTWTLFYGLVHVYD